jgi:ribosome-associated protein
LSIASRNRALEIVRLALDKKASDLILLEMRDLVPYTDYFVICSGESTQQVKTISEHIKESLAKKRIKPMGVEGQTPGRWVLMDYNDVIVHVFERETRDYYMLEKLWLDAPRIPVDEVSDNLGRKDKRKLCR